MLLIDRRDIVEPVEIRNRLEIGLVLDQLFGAAVEQADMRVDPLDHLAVKLEHQPQHAMRGRMLRPEIDGESALDIARGGVGFQHHASSFTLAALAATRALNLSQATTKRSCRPSPIRSMPSCALTLKETRAPATSIHSTSTVTVMPGGVAAR